MASVDDRVVAIKFDNKDFERNVTSTISSIDKLNASIDSAGQNKALDNIAKADKDFRLSGMHAGIDAVSAKFVAMQAVAIGAIGSITSMAVSKGAEIVSALSMTPVIEGFKEYETGINSTQTILANTASKGTLLPDVDAALEKLNTYADQTIYNFGQMTKAAGTFTAAGLGLDDAVSAVKGISNLAGISGASAEQASSAYVQLGQALSGAGLRAQDWISINTAQLGGTVFQSSLFETAKALGTLTNSPVGETFEQWRDRGNDFKEAMSEGVFTSDVLALSLQAFTGDLTDADLAAKGFTGDQITRMQETAKNAKDATTDVKTFTQLMSTTKESIGSGWSGILKVVIGDFDQAKIFFSGLYVIFNSTIGRFMDARKALAENWRDLGGREAMIQSLRNVLWAVASVIGVVHKAFRDAFPAKTGEDLANISKGIERFTKMLIPSGETLEKIGKIFGGLFSILSIGWNVIKETFNVFKQLFGLVGNMPGGGILEFIASWADKITNLKKVLVDDGGIANFFKTFIQPIVDFIRKIQIAEQIQNIIDKFGEFKRKIEDFTGINFDGFIDSISKGFAKVKEFFGNLLKTDLSAGTDKMGEATDALGKKWESFISIGEKLGNFFDKIEGFIKPFGEMVSNIFKSIGDAFEKGDYNKIMDGINTGIMAVLAGLAAKFVLGGGFKFELFGDWFGENGKFTQMFEQFTGVFKAMQTELKAQALKTLAIAILMIVASIVILTLLDPVKLTAALFAVSVGMGELVGSLVLLNKHADDTSSTKMAVLAGSVIAISIALLIMAFALKKLSELDPNAMFAGLIGMTALLIGMLVFINALQEMVKDMPKDKDIGDMIKVGIAMVLMAFGMNKMADAVVKLGALNFGTLAKGLIGIAVILGIVVVAMKHMPSKTDSASVGIFAVGLWLLTHVIEQMGSMDIEKLRQGLIGIGLAIGGIVLALNGLPPDMLGIGIGLLLVTAAMWVMVRVIEDFARMDVGTLIGGMAKLGGALIVLGIGMRFMTGSIEGAIALVIVVAALWLVVGVIEKLNNIGWAGVFMFAVVLILLGGAIAILVGSATLLSAAAPAIELFAGALVTLGLGIFLIAASVFVAALGILALAVALAILGSIGAEGIRNIAMSLPELGTGVGKAFTNFLIAVMENVPRMIGAFQDVVDAIILYLYHIVPQLGVLLTFILDVMIANMRLNFPKITALGFDLLMMLLQGIDENIDQITFFVAQIIVKFMTALGIMMPDLIAAGANLLNNFLTGIRNEMPMIALNVLLLILEFLGALTLMIPFIVDKGKELLGELVRGLTEIGLYLLIQIEIAAVKLADGFGNMVDKFVEIGVDLLIGIVEGFALAVSDPTNIQRLKDAGVLLGMAVVNGLTFGIAFQEEIATKRAELMANNVAEIAGETLGVHSPSTVFMEFGKQVVNGLAIGLSNTSAAVAGAETLSNDVISSMNSTMSELSTVSSDIGSYNPTITPVLDITGVQEEAKKLDDLMTDPMLTLGPSIEQAKSMSLSEKDKNALSLEPGVSDTQVKQVTFEQTINSPTSLNASDIYRQTRAQIALAQEELRV